MIKSVKPHLEAGADYSDRYLLIAGDRRKNSYKIATMSQKLVQITLKCRREKNVCFKTISAHLSVSLILSRAVNSSHIDSLTN